MREDSLRAMIDSGSSRVFDCNGISLKLIAEGAGSDALFFRHPALNHVVMIKQSTLPSERRNFEDPPVATKLFFPFNEHDARQGGNTIFVHEKHLEAALDEKCGVNRSLDREAFDDDVRILRLLAKLPTLDPFLIRDTLETESVRVNEHYLEMSDEQWNEIQGCIHQRFVPILKAAYPDANESRGKAKQLLETLWAAKDAAALAPIIKTFGLPEDGALQALYSWKVITFYAYQYQRLRPMLLAMAQWLKEVDSMPGFAAIASREPMRTLRLAVRNELRKQWGKIDKIVTEYDDGYEKMFVKKTETGPFLRFLRSCRAIFWEIGDSLGKLDHTIYCWDKITKRYPARRVHPVDMVENTFAVLAEILGNSTDAEPVAAAG